jgi:4'-phosphopantetheinyl transferase
MKTINVYYADVSDLLNEKFCKESADQLPSSLSIRNFNYRNVKDKVLSLSGRLLLNKGLNNLRLSNNQLKLILDENRRPFISKHFDFNISHSGSLVTCAIANGVRLGIDIEWIQPVKFNDYSSCMSAQEWKEIEKSENPLKEFFVFWTVKESVIKADKRGMSIPLKNIQIFSDYAQVDSIRWYLHRLDLN